VFCEILFCVIYRISVFFLQISLKDLKNYVKVIIIYMKIK